MGDHEYEGLPDRYQRGLQDVNDAVLNALPSTASASRRERLAQAVVALTDQLTELAQRPDEPEGKLPVVTFRYRYARGDKVRFTFAAIKAGDGYWYITGRETRRYTWDSLLDFIYRDPQAPPTLKVASGWTRLVTDDVSRRRGKR